MPTLYSLQGQAFNLDAAEHVTAVYESAYVPDSRWAWLIRALRGVQARKPSYGFTVSFRSRVSAEFWFDTAEQAENERKLLLNASNQPSGV